jgi:hypothetical protein
MNGFINHLYAPLGTTSNYSAIAELHTTNHYMLSLLQPPVSSTDVPLQRTLTVKLLQLTMLRSNLHN